MPYSGGSAIGAGGRNSLLLARASRRLAGFRLSAPSNRRDARSRRPLDYSTALHLPDRRYTILRMELNVQAISLIIAVWGAITGTTALTLNLVTFFTERARLKLAWLKGYVILTVGPHTP